MTPEELLSRATEFDGGNPPEHYGMLVEEEDTDIEFHYHPLVSLRVNAEGERKWAVSMNGRNVLTKRGDWIYEPSPSSRTKAFFKRTRFDSVQEAFDTLNAWKEKERKRLRKEGRQTYKQWCEAGRPMPEFRSQFT